MKNTSTQQYSSDDTIACRKLPQQLREQVIMHQVRKANLELCDTIIAEVEHTALCKLIAAAEDLTDHAVLEN